MSTINREMFKTILMGLAAFGLKGNRLQKRLTGPYFAAFSVNRIIILNPAVDRSFFQLRP